jgi:hypothetical protein
MWNRSTAHQIPKFQLKRKWSYSQGRAIRMAVSRWLPTATSRFQSQVKSCGICGGQSGVGVSFLWGLRFPLPILIPHTAPHLTSTISPHLKKLKHYLYVDLFWLCLLSRWKWITIWKKKGKGKYRLFELLHALFYSNVSNHFTSRTPYTLIVAATQFILIYFTRFESVLVALTHTDTCF